jgi:hypothetical protein
MNCIFFSSFGPNVLTEDHLFVGEGTMFDVWKSSGFLLGFMTLVSSANVVVLIEEGHVCVCLYIYKMKCKAPRMDP